jgi:hypothetical protein
MPSSMVEARVEQGGAPESLTAAPDPLNGVAEQNAAAGELNGASPDPAPVAPVPAEPVQHNGDESLASEAPSVGEARWLIRLTDHQLQEAFRWLGDDAPVLAADAQEWIRLGDLRRAWVATSSPEHG